MTSAWQAQAPAAQAGFSYQSHLTRWFVRCYGITPGGYQRATALAPQPAA
jgi:AraC-like DNA-binding protein